ncbi:hypothetical protein GGR44_001183 [Sphingobium fontiphilum]|uniref:DUF3885 domain-containing protein n=1 Tax=Sphingobium fontiphilum TaxID=944425 RepID=A0A7W6DHR0_9SPHN|nr:hypothetical protein [Sphingobium fontiphilum]MBB3981536.1 hypothetical protein [Sphingobium fontiphilum]
MAAMTENRSEAADFRHDWTKFYPTCLPLGWMLRSRADSPWVRFHALPYSKRYADNQVEREIILARANKCGDRLLGPGQWCWVVEAEFSGPTVPNDVVLSGPDTDDPDKTWNFYARRERWLAGKYNRLLLSIADDGPGTTIWMRCDNGAVFAPYDGGFDLFPVSWDIVSDLKAEWPDWLSDHPKGL